MQDFLPAEQATAFLELYKKKAVRQKRTAFAYWNKFCLSFFFSQAQFYLAIHAFSLRIFFI